MRIENSTLIYGSGALVVGPNADISMEGASYVPWDVQNCYPVMFIDVSRKGWQSLDRVIEHSSHAYIEGITGMAIRLRDRWRESKPSSESMVREKEIYYRTVFHRSLPTQDHRLDVVDLFRGMAETIFKKTQQMWGGFSTQAVHSTFPESPDTSTQESKIAMALEKTPSLYRTALDHSWTRIVVAHAPRRGSGASFWPQRLITIAPETLLAPASFVETVLTEEAIHHADSLTGFSERGSWKQKASLVLETEERVPGIAHLINQMDIAMGKMPLSTQPQREKPAELLVNATRLRDSLPEILKKNPDLNATYRGFGRKPDDIIRALCPTDVDLPALLDQFQTEIKNACGHAGPTGPSSPFKRKRDPSPR